MADRIRLRYADGSEDTLAVRARGLIEAERHLGKNPPPLEASFYAVWSQLGKPSTFDAWVDSIEDFEQVEDPTTDPVN